MNFLEQEIDGENVGFYHIVNIHDPIEQLIAVKPWLVNRYLNRG